MLGTNNIDHHRTADYTAFARAISGQKDRAASLRESGTAPAILLLGNDPTEQHPLLAWNLRTNVRHHNARIYIVNHAGIKLERQAQAVADHSPGRLRQRRCASWPVTMPPSLARN